MIYAKPDNTEVGQTVSVPINGKFMHDEQICQEYVVVKALKCLTPQSGQIVGTGEEPMPMLLEFTDETALI